MKPLVIDLFCGLGGWSEGFLAEGYECIGFDIERHNYGTGCYPGQLVLQDVTTLHGSQFKGAAVIVASPPCTEPSYRAMPWKSAKALTPDVKPEWWIKKENDMDESEMAEWRRWKLLNPLPPPANFLALFDACFRIQREACEAAGRHIPMVVENVRGAQKWIGRANAHFGSYYLWGSVGMVGKCVVAALPRFGFSIAPVKATKVPGFRFDGVSHGSFQSAGVAAQVGGYKSTGMNWSDQTKRGQDFTRVAGGQALALKTVGHCNKRDGYGHTRHLTNQRESDAVKEGGDWWNQECRKTGMARFGSKSNSRKAASAQIAKIPFALARHIARCYKP